MRPADQVAKGHIPKSVALPKDGIESLKDQFPKFMGAVVILVDENGVSEASKKAFKTISDWGYKQVSILNHGFNGWLSAGKAVATGPAASSINYVRKLLPGEVDLALFKAQLEKPSPDTIILDVRAPSEVADGKLPNTVQLPLDELEIRMSELPKDKKIMIHCATGARAEMAYNLLKNAGLNGGYVRVKLSFDKEKPGTFTLEE